jgi:hypothetical protein
MRRGISEKTRLTVAQRAGFRCEYCKIHSDDLFLGFEIDHVIALKHGGNNALENLAYACPHCNQHKGTDFATFLDDFERIIPIYNPRLQSWLDHFETINGEIIPKTQIGQASIKIFKFNQVDLLILRSLLSKIGRYP